MSYSTTTQHLDGDQLIVDTGLGPKNGETIACEMKKVSSNAAAAVIARATYNEAR